MFAWISNASTYIVSNYGVHISWALSFFVNRLITKTSDESYKESGAIAAAVASVAAVDFTLRNQEYVKTYAITYGTMTVSYVYPIARSYDFSPGNSKGFFRDIFIDIYRNIAPVTSAAISGVCVYSIVQLGYTQQSIMPAAIGFSNYKLIGPSGAFYSTSLSVVDKVLIGYNYTNSHYLSSLATAWSICRYSAGNLVVCGVSFPVLLIFAENEQEILRYFLPIDSARETYSLLLESSRDKAYARRLLETSLVSTLNIEMGSGVFFLKMLNVDIKFFTMLKTVCDDKNKFPEFINLAIEFLSINLKNIFLGSFVSPPVTGYVLNNVKKSFKDDFFASKIYHSNNLIILSSSNFTAETYSSDLSAALTIHWTIAQNIGYNLPAAACLVNLGRVTIVVPMIAITDAGFMYVLNFFQDLIQTANEQQTEVFTVLGMKEKHDIENAHTLVHGNVLDYMKNSWQSSLNMGDEHKYNGVVYKNLYDSLHEIYWNVLIWGGIPISIVYLFYKDFIAANGVIESTLAIKNVISTVLIKSHKKQELNAAETSIKRLQGFFARLEEGKDFSDNVSLQYDSQSQLLIVRDLYYVRGDDRSNVTVQIPSLSLEKGKKYVVTGSNGSGKSSFLLLLNLLVNSLIDKSFLEVRGVVHYYSSDISMVTQKDYCPLYADLFSWLVYSSKLRGDNHTQEFYGQKIEAILADLKFSPKNLHSLEQEFHLEKKDWCKELSGGQIKKVQMMQSVFIPDQCPEIILMDETMGPLDSESKKLVQQMLVEKCKASLIMIVYHYDHVTSCAPGAEFFDYNIHFENGTAVERTLCGADL